MSKVTKTVLQVTLLRDDVDETGDISHYELSDIALNMEYGPWVGTTEVLSVEDVPPEKVREELLAVGNDGEFFNAGE